MGRWQPDAQRRLAGAALTLYAERGFEQTTVAGIAARAGLTERTFFRHFADKREVLFAGSAIFEQHLVAALAAAPPDATPLAAVRAGVSAVTELLTDRDHSRARQQIIDAHPDLQERELIKLASLSAAFAAALRERGVPDPAAPLAAEAAVAVFKVAFTRWLEPRQRKTLATLIDESFASLAGVTAGP